MTLGDLAGGSQGINARRPLPLFFLPLTSQHHLWAEPNQKPEARAAVHTGDGVTGGVSLMGPR